MKIIDQNLHLINNAQDQAVGVAQETTKAVEGFLVLAYVGVIANTWERFRG
jgi:hypothetical protein